MRHRSREVNGVLTLGSMSRLRIPTLLRPYSSAYE